MCPGILRPLFSLSLGERLVTILVLQIVLKYISYFNKILLYLISHQVSYSDFLKWIYPTYRYCYDVNLHTLLHYIIYY